VTTVFDARCSKADVGFLHFPRGCASRTTMGPSLQLERPRGVSCKVKLSSNSANIFETSSIRRYLSFAVLLMGFATLHCVPPNTDSPMDSRLAIEIPELAGLLSAEGLRCRRSIDRVANQLMCVPRAVGARMWLKRIFYPSRRKFRHATPYTSWKINHLAIVGE
jgi:hypothetical protein